MLEAWDANQDFAIDESDLVEAFKSGKYRSGEFASWSEGDWNGAPGGRRGLPPIGDGLFNESDLIAAFKNGLFRTGDYSAREVQTINVSEPNGSPRIIATIIGCIVLRIMGLRVICDSKAPPESRAST